MTPQEAAARFAAFVWYTETLAPGRATPEQARDFADANWAAFLPAADEGLGRLLLRLARPQSRKRRGRRKRRPALAC